MVKQMTKHADVFFSKKVDTKKSCKTHRYVFHYKSCCHGVFLVKHAPKHVAACVFFVKTDAKSTQLPLPRN